MRGSGIRRYSDRSSVVTWERSRHTAVDRRVPPIEFRSFRVTALCLQPETDDPSEDVVMCGHTGTDLRDLSQPSLLVDEEERSVPQTKSKKTLYSFLP